MKIRILMVEAFGVKTEAQMPMELERILIAIMNKVGLMIMMDLALQVLQIPIEEQNHFRKLKLQHCNIFVKTDNSPLQ